MDAFSNALCRCSGRRSALEKMTLTRAICITMVLARCCRLVLINFNLSTLYPRKDILRGKSAEPIYFDLIRRPDLNQNTSGLIDKMATAIANTTVLAPWVRSPSACSSSWVNGRAHLEKCLQTKSLMGALSSQCCLFVYGNFNKRMRLGLAIVYVLC